jgi:hypothetical protein
MAMNDVDRGLLRVGALSLQDRTDEVFAKIEELLPALIETGYAEVEDNTWGFSPKGVARVEELGRVADS